MKNGGNYLSCQMCREGCVCGGANISWAEEKCERRTLSRMQPFLISWVPVSCTLVPGLVSRLARNWGGTVEVYCERDVLRALALSLLETLRSLAVTCTRRTGTGDTRFSHKTDTRARTCGSPPLLARTHPHTHTHTHAQTHLNTDKGTISTALHEACPSVSVRASSRGACSDPGLYEGAETLVTLLICSTMGPSS